MKNFRAIFFKGSRRRQIFSQFVSLKGRDSVGNRGRTLDLGLRFKPTGLQWKNAGLSAVLPLSRIPLVDLKRAVTRARAAFGIPLTFFRGAAA